MKLRRTLTTRSIARKKRGVFEGGGFTVTLSRIDRRDMVEVVVDGCSYYWETFDVETFDEQRARVAADVGFRSHFRLMSGDPSMYGADELKALRNRREERVA